MAAKKEAEQLPKVLFAVREQDGDDSYLIADEDRGALAEDDPRIVGKYRLIESGELKRKATYKRQR